ncbi:MAG: hypothetical protein HZA54_17985, partial [Planctomycetes bacterium]|nr:hypothetical protein [Planctomycetota bacterium]
TPLGTYRVVVSRKNGPTFSGQFEVQEYPLERVALSVTLDREVLFRGEALKGKIKAGYYYGEPVAGRSVRYRIGDLPEQSGVTDAKGEIAFEIPTRDFAESAAVPIAAALDEEGVSASAVAYVATTGFGVAISTVRGVYLVGEPFDVSLTALDPAGKPVAVADLRLAVVRLDADPSGALAETEVRGEPAATEAKEGKARVSLTLDQGGRYVLRASGTDRFGNKIVARRDLFVSGDEDTTKVRLLSDKDEWRVGDEASIRVINRAARGLALVTYEGDRIYRHQVIDLAAGESALAVAMNDDLAPNFVLAVATMNGNAFHVAAKEFLVTRGLTIKLTTDKEKYAPGDEVTVKVETTDPLGRAVGGEVSLAVVDEGLFAVAPDALPAIAEFFYGQRRGVQVATASSCSWKYEAKTVAAVPELNEELKRLQDLRVREREFERLRDRARREVARVSRGDSGQPNSAGLTWTFGAGADYFTTEAGAFDRTQEGRQVQLPDGRVVTLGVPQEGWNEQSFDGHVESVSPERALSRDKTAATLGVLGAVRSSISLHFTKNALPTPTGGQRAWWPQVAGRESKMANNPFANARQGRFLALGRLGLPAAGPGPLAALVRARFPDTGYWNPSIVTGADGKATVKFKLPDNATTWRLTAYGATRDTLVGKGTAALTARKDFFVDLRLPDVLVEGDKPRVQARVVNGTDAKATATLTLEAQIGSKSVSETRTVEVDAHATAEVEFVIAVPAGAETGDAREARFTLTGAIPSAQKESEIDALTRTVPVEPWGTELRRGAGGIESMDRTETLELPAKDYARRALRIVLGASPDRTLLDLAGIDFADDPGLPRGGRDVAALGGAGAYLARGGAAADGLTLLAVLDYLDATGRGAAGDRRRLEARLFALAEHLAVTQNDDGGWSWTATARNARPSEPHMTADALRFFSGLKKKGYPVPA